MSSKKVPTKKSPRSLSANPIRLLLKRANNLCSGAHGEIAGRRRIRQKEEPGTFSHFKRSSGKHPGFIMKELRIRGKDRALPHQAPRSGGLSPAQQRTEQEDLPLITQAQAGDREAFALLVQRHGKAVFSLIDKMLRDRHTAEDLWQETFVRALENLALYEPRLRADGTGPSFASWLYRIAANLTLDELRKRNRWQLFSWSLFKPRRAQDPEAVEEYDPPAETPDALEALATKEDILRVRRALTALSPEWRMMLILREFQDLPYEEIAEIINAPIGTVRSRLARAREQLRVALLRQTA